MSRIMIAGRVQVAGVYFAATRYQAGPQAIRHGRSFGGQWGCCLIGPDLKLPGGLQHNPPSAAGAPWNGLYPGTGRPQVAFTDDTLQHWKRGHLVNGEWGGSGASWSNLVPLTAVANSNHATIEAYMKTFSHASSIYEEAGPWRDEWIGVAYLVQASNDSWGDPSLAHELYCYTPNFIRISWRAVSISKPVNLQPGALPAFFANLSFAAGTISAVPALPFAPPARPAVLTAAVTGCLPLNNQSGGAVYAAPGHLVLPPEEPNGFDGQVEIHQS